MEDQPEHGQWEYWIWDPATTWNRDLDRHFIGGVDEETKTWSDVLNAAGRRSWELISVTELIQGEGVNVPGVRSARFYFKRRLGSFEAAD